MPLNSRRKGAAGERELAAVLTAAGFPARRDGRLDADLDCDLPGTHIEVKRSEKPRIADWCAQAARDALKYGKPSWAVVWRCSRQPWVVTIPLDEYLRLRLLEADHEA